MAKNVFDQIGDIRNNINRNNFDWSKTNNFTTALGRITPVYCELCPPNSSLKIKPQFGLRFMPMMFPVQTNMKAYLSFYRVPLRTLWKDYKDWISSPNDADNNLTPPYIDAKAERYGEGKMFGISGLADYLNIPNTVSYNSLPLDGLDFDTDGLGISLVAGGAGNGYRAHGEAYNTPSSGSQKYNAIPICTTAEITGVTTTTYSSYRVTITLRGNQASAVYNSLQSDQTIYLICVKGSSLPAAGSQADCYGNTNYIGADFDEKTNILTLYYGAIVPNSRVLASEIYTLALMAKAYPSLWNNGSTAAMTGDKHASFVAYDSSALMPTVSPYWTSERLATQNQIKLSAYPFRAYEAVYNAYMRNIKNNPFKIGTKTVYNTWIPTDAGGADATDYQLHYANWASDMFTTAVPSPQQGQAPLVGITTYSRQVTLENGHVETQLGTAIVDEDGKKYDITFESNGEELKDVRYRELDQNTPVQQVNNLYDLVTSGISINDFRNVNAYQRYLELNQMRGYSYKEIIDGRFDVNVKYCDLLMPEYLGGCTRDIQMNAITQTVETNDSGTYQGALGSQAGNATLFASSEDISVFCDEESIVIGVLSVVPMPVYTQVLPKHFLYRDRLDSFNPEFDHIGFQPITKKEIAPVQTWIADPTKMDDVFGYQRPWYEYCQKLDTASGLFKTQLRNFLINRVFMNTPELNSAFTTVDPSEVNDVFSVTETTDKILGQIYFDVVAKLPISRVSVPKLE